MIHCQTALPRLSSISVFFPAYNDEASIAGMVTLTLALLPQLTADYEVLVVNDGSRDGTAAVLDALARQHAQVRVIHHPVNRGYGGALRTGFLNATKEWVFYTDGDGQYDVRELSQLVALVCADVDVVNGHKRQRADSKRRIVLGAVYKFLARWLFQLPIRDVDCDFRLLRRSVMKNIELASTSGVVCTELVYKLQRAGARFVETPVQHYPRLHGQSQFFTLRQVAQTALDFFVLWFRLVVWQRLAGQALTPAESLAKPREELS